MAHNAAALFFSIPCCVVPADVLCRSQKCFANHFCGKHTQPRNRLTAILSDRAYLFAVSAILCAVIFGIAEIICSFFTSAKSGYKRDIIAFSVNFGVTVLMSFCSVGFGARAKAGLILTLLIYFIRFILQNAVHKKGVNTYNTVVALIIVGAVIASSCFVYRSPKVTYTPPKTLTAT